MAVKQLPYTMLDLVNIVDTWPYPSSTTYQAHLQSYYTLHISPFPSPIGYLHRNFVTRIPWPCQLWTVDHTGRRITLTAPDPSSIDSRTEAMRLTLQAGHACPDPVRSLRRWTNEPFPLFYPPTREIVLQLDGCGVDMLGGINESVFLVAYVTDLCRDQEEEHDDDDNNNNNNNNKNNKSMEQKETRTRAGAGETHKLWVSRRAAWKSAYPKMWDCTAGGGLAWGETPLDGIVREAWEEVGLDRDLVREKARYVGENRVMLCRTELGEEGCQMQVQHLFEIDLTGGGGEGGPGGAPGDDAARPDLGRAVTEEVMEVGLAGVEEVRGLMRDGEMKPGAAMVVLDWMVRWGYVSERTEGEGAFEEIRKRLKRDFVVA